jgi:glucose/arabinose dehydrogenase
MFEALEPRLLLSATPTEIISPQELTTAAVTIPAGSLPNLDVDLNGQADALSDGIVIIRHLFGFTGNALVDGSIDPLGQRTDPTAIQNYLNSISGALDVDLNQQADALSDGIVIIRSLFGFSGTALTDGVVDPTGQRTDPTVIATFLDNMNPQRELLGPNLTAGLQQDTGISATDVITLNPTITGTIADISQIAVFTAGFDAAPVGSFVDVLADLQTTGAFTLSAAQLTQIAGGTLADGAHTLHLRATDTRGNLGTFDHSFLLDTTAPDIHLEQPADGALVSDIVVITAHATDDIGVVGLQFYVDGVPTGLLDTVAPYALTWDTRTVGNGAHTLTTQAYDTSGNAALSLPVTVNVSNTNLFRNEILATGFDLPTAIKFLPDGRMLVVEFAGTIRVVPAPYTQVDPTPFLQLTDVPLPGPAVNTGIIDLALDPNFSTNHFYYIFYTAGTSTSHDRLSRFTANASLTGTIAGSEFVLYEDPLETTASSQSHHGGAITFDNDGKIYFTTGDHFNGSNSQLLTNPRGKLHRINPDGTVPTDNPFYDGAGPNWDSIWAIGLRNPFRAYYDAPTDRLLIGDVGGNDYSTAIEEVNIGVRGANYGWPNIEAPTGDPTYTAPAYYYTHIVNGTPRDASITGGFVYHGTQFPSSYQGSYFFADYTQNWIHRLTFDATGNVSGVFNFEPADGSVDGPYGDIVYLTEGPDGALYYVDLGFADIGGAFGVSKIRRVEFIQSNLPPVVSASATPLGGPTPLTVNFSSAGSADPEGLPLAYSWNFGDGTAISTEADPAHIYTIAGPYQARLTVSDGVNATISTPLSISAGNQPVIANLLVTVPPNPASNGLFRAGDVISYSAQATDFEDGPLPASAFTLNIDFLHEGHVHPGTPITGVTSGSFAIPTSGHDFSGFTRYRITLTVTDSDGLQSTQAATVFPDKVNLTFDTAPGGLTLYVDGIAHQAPFVYDTLIGFEHTIDARDQTVSTSTYTFASWSDGGAQSHQIFVQEGDQSYVAAFQETTSASVSVGTEPVIRSTTLLTAPSVLDDGALTSLVLPSEMIWNLGDVEAISVQPGNMLTRLDDFRQRGRFRGITGAGMTAVVIDTGIDVDHPFFGPDADYNGVADRIIFQYDFADHDTDASDRNGHGSHIASLIGSEDSTYPGVAPDADLIALKVFSDTGAGTFANVEQALQWVIAHAAEYSIDVVNLSLGDGRNWTVPGAQYGIGDEFSALADDGIVVVAAAGNNFFTAQGVPGVAYPAADPNVIGVGAVWTADFGGPWRWSSGAIDLTTGPDRIASFSQRDPTMTEIFAPGARLIGANHLGGIVTMQGTSQAAAYLSGTALLAQQLAEHDLGRTLTPEEFTRLVAGTGTVILDGDDEQDNVVNTGETFSRLDVLQLAKGIHRYAAWERGEGGHHSHHGFALAYTQRCWVKDFVAGTAAESVHNEEELLIALSG